MNLFDRLDAKIAALQKQIDAEKSPKGLSYVEFEKMTDKPRRKWFDTVPAYPFLTADEISEVLAKHYKYTIHRSKADDYNERFIKFVKEDILRSNELCFSIDKWVKKK